MNKIISFLTCILTCAITLTLTLTIPAFSAEFNLANLHAPFKIFVEQYRNKPFDQQWSGWNEFKAKYPDLIPPTECRDCEERKKQSVRDFFTLLPKFEKQMWDMFANAGEVTAAQIARFKKVFPDLPSDVAIAFVPSMFGFNGQVRNVHNVGTLFIGVDFVAFRNDDLDVLFSHEFFHLYQGIVLTRLGKPSFQTLASRLWFEGMATWVSIKFNPGTSDSVALMDESLALPKFCAQEESVRSAAKEFLKVIDLNQESDAHGDWFKLIGKTEPKRRGYCLGLHVLRRLSQEFTVQELVTLGEPEFSPLIKSTLEKF